MAGSQGSADVFESFSLNFRLASPLNKALRRFPYTHSLPRLQDLNYLRMEKSRLHR